MAQEIVGPQKTEIHSWLRSATEPSKNILALIEDLSKPPEQRYGLICPQELHDEAIRLISACDDALRPASSETVGKWLTALGGTCAVASGPSQDAKEKVWAYINVLDFPPICYTHGTLKRAARKFKFFPTVSELSEFFAEIVGPIKKTRFGAERVSKSKVESRYTPREKRKENPVFLSAMEKWDAVKAANSEREEAMKRAIPKTIFKPIYVQNPETDAYADRARMIEDAKRND